MIMLRVGMLHEVGSSAVMTLFIDSSVAASEALRPSGNWPAEQEEETKQREEEALHKSSFQMRPELN
jgi:hypothetical protein